MKKSHLRGHSIVSINGQWVYEDSMEPTATTCKDRPCGFCNKPNRSDDHDACLGTLPGIMNACCGHGVEKEAYVQFLDGKCARGKSALIILNELKKWK